MTRFDPAPQPFLSPNGRFSGLLLGEKLWLLDTVTAYSTELELPHSANLIAFAPAAEHFVISGEAQISLFNSGSPPQLLGTRPTITNLYRLALGPGGWVAGVISLDKAECSCLLAWQGEGLAPLWPGQGQSLGPVYIEELLLDGRPELVLLWGFEAPEHEYNLGDRVMKQHNFQAAFQGTGRRFAGLYHLAKNGLQPVWNIEASLLAEANGFLMPSSQGTIGIYDQEKLQIWAEGEIPYPDWRLLKTYRLNKTTRLLAVSPSGKYLARLWGEVRKQQAVYHLQIIDLAPPTASDRGPAQFELHELGAFPVLAVNDEGSATLAYGKKPESLVVLQLRNGDPAKIYEKSG
jgi:hypothetical protein